jgi:hypothetical protein
MAEELPSNSHLNDVRGIWRRVPNGLKMATSDSAGGSAGLAGLVGLVGLVGLTMAASEKSSLRRTFLVPLSPTSTLIEAERSFSTAKGS